MIRPVSETWTLQINGEPRTVAPIGNVEELLQILGLGTERVAIELNRRVIRRRIGSAPRLQTGTGSRLCNSLVAVEGAGMAYTLEGDPLVIAGRQFRSRLFTGTGKYSTFAVMREALEQSGSEVVTVAVRRVDLSRSRESRFWTTSTRAVT